MGKEGFGSKFLKIRSRKTITKYNDNLVDYTAEDLIEINTRKTAVCLLFQRLK